MMTGGAMPALSCCLFLDSEDAALLQSEIAALDENLGEHLPSGIIHADFI